MDNKVSKVAGSSDTTAKEEQDSAQSEGATSDEQINVHMVQNILLIWLDSTIDGNCADYRNTITRLQRTVKMIETFTDGEECIQFLELINNDKACMIISGSLGQDIVSRVHPMTQVHSIFIFCGNKEYHEQWAKKWSKIKGVFTEIVPLCEALNRTAQQYKENDISISLMVTTNDVSKKNLDHLESSFMYLQILKEVLLTIKFEQKHFMEFIEYCRDVLADSEVEMKNVKNLERNYRQNTPVWWYTSECFLYPMLSRAIQVMDMDLIIKMGFFINDLHRHIERLHLEQFGDRNSDKSFTVYRGQGMLKEEFRQLTNTKGGFISFNNFLSTSKDRDDSCDFAHDALLNRDMVGILFLMNIDPAKSTTPFASITDVGYYGDKEDKVLFTMHAVFRIRGIKPIGKNERLFQVELELASDNDKDLRLLIDQIRVETYADQEGWYRLGSVLLKMGQTDKAEQVYEMQLEQATEENEKAPVYQQIGWMKCNQEEYEKAIIFYQKALEINEKTLPPDHPDLAKFYNTIASVYNKLGEYPKAASFYEKALEIHEKTLPSNHPDLNSSCNNIGGVYYNMGEYSKALSFHEKLLKIREKSLSPNHPDLVVSYIKIAELYRNLDDYPKTLLFHEKAFKIQQKSLPSNHPDLASSYDYIGEVHRKMNNYSKALSSHEKALEIRQQSLPPNHPDLAISYGHIGKIYYTMGKHSDALSFCKRAVEIAQQSLPSNDPQLKWYRNNLDRVREKL